MDENTRAQLETELEFLESKITTLEQCKKNSPAFRSVSLNELNFMVQECQSRVNEINQLLAEN